MFCTFTFDRGLRFWSDLLVLKFTAAVGFSRGLILFLVFAFCPPCLISFWFTAFFSVPLIADIELRGT